MTYIKVDTNFIELEKLSHLLRLPKALIEEVVDKGYVSSEDHTCLNEDLLNVIRRIRLAAFLSSANIAEHVREEIMSGNFSLEEYQTSLIGLYQREKISKDELSRLSQWDSSNPFEDTTAGIDHLNRS
ncbi:hypothetical protein H6763_01430 [Candidatus Nomurabacteria bacterium]|uniref:Uncharacterized protein n=1 Tax=Candidatus Dojkabacteria bacterium TaxID=2099670 RepID=A0A955I2X5_9BACT|nr:hypothetical protein [Candidatus Dojkabacteria bacterium]MCB9789908.1 hypothetical protein [Candidatus Nomurabacteria bacterium]MCB9803469.1 hypothetical protein [Candidatus Nomurabacteria bacterium]